MTEKERINEQNRFEKTLLKNNPLAYAVYMMKMFHNTVSLKAIKEEIDLLEWEIERFPDDVELKPRNARIIAGLRDLEQAHTVSGIDPEILVDLFERPHLQ